ncbi:MAG: PLP-dependent aminotransferase family protein [Deltaproteobacteria bacterium]|nr:PLP-dependent aminotransferase family protein [Deltaproteobacteria bacterium]
MDERRPRWSTRALRRTPSPIRELMPLLSLEGMISLGGGYPNPETFAFRQVRVELKQPDGGEGGASLLLEGPELLQASQYGATEGLPALLEQLRGWQRFKDGVELDRNQLLLLNGSQEGLYIAADLLLDEGDEVVVDEPTYPGALAAFRSFTDRFLAIALDGEGMCTDELSRLLERRRERGEPLPRFVYTIPNGHNPAGVTLSEPRRHALAELARRYDLLLLEDDPYQLLDLDGGERLPTLQRLAPERVLRLDSFSKILCPGLRLGYATGPAELVRAMVLHKQASNLHTSSFAQALLQAYFRAEGNTGLLQRVQASVALYRRSRDAMVAAAHRHLPPEIRFQVPRAGMFLWFALPAGCDAGRMVQQDARELGVLLVPGGAFSAQGGCRNALRASYSMVDPPRIEEGMRRFAEMIRRELARG